MTDNYDLEMAIRYLARQIHDLNENLEKKVHPPKPQHNLADEHSEHDVLEGLNKFSQSIDDVNKLRERLGKICEKFFTQEEHTEIVVHGEHGELAEVNSNLQIVEKHIPLTNKNYEATLLGALMLDNGAFEIVSERVKERHFETQRHRNIFKAMIQLRKDNKLLDTLSVYEELERSGQGDLDMEKYLFDLAKNTLSAHIEHLPSLANVVWSNYHDRKRKVNK